MLWLNPFALLALASVALPILIHLMIQRRAERFPFPTLRFLQPTRLAAIRRHLIEDLPLLAVRMAVLAAAVAAVAGPLLATPARRQAWDRRMVRAVVTDDVARYVEGRDREGGPAASAPGALGRASSKLDGSVAERRRERPALQRTFSGVAISDGIRRAIVWLGTAPPARREIVIASPFPIGSITPADVAAIPADIGVRFERTGTLPRTRIVPGGRVLTPDGARAREVTFDGDRTSVRDTLTAEPLAWPIDVVAATADQPAIDAAIAAVLSQRVWAGPPDRRARVVLLPQATPEADLKVRTTSEVVQAFRPAVIQQPWMADAVSRIAADRDLRDAASRVAAGLSDAAFAVAPWQILTSAADGRPLAVAAGLPDRLVVASAARAADVATPLLLRAIANAIAVPPDLQPAEVVPIADALLQRWSRAAAPLSSPRIQSVDEDDRRWLWLAALLLIALEVWMRRARTAERVGEGRPEDARVA